MSDMQRDDSIVADLRSLIYLWRMPTRANSDREHCSDRLEEIIDEWQAAIRHLTEQNEQRDAMSKWTLEQVRDWHRDQGGKASADRHMGLAGMHYDMMAALDAHLAAQAEWPSEEDVQTARDAYVSNCDDCHPSLYGMRAALQSVRPPAEIDIELEREIFDLCKQFADPYPSWVVKHITWLRHVFASRPTPTAHIKD